MTNPLNNPLFLVPVVSGLIFILAGYVMLKFPPKNINSIYGYRTNSSMKNKERWDFAQTYSAMESIKLGALLSLIGILGLWYHPATAVAMFMGITLLALTVLALLLRVENAIKRKFEK